MNPNPNLNPFSWKVLQPNRLALPMTNSEHVYEVRRRKDGRGIDLISDALPFGRLWYGEPMRSIMQSGTRRTATGHMDAVIRVYNAAGNLIQTREHAGEFKGGNAQQFYWLLRAVCGAAVLISIWALTFWICPACSFTVVTRLATVASNSSTLRCSLRNSLTSIAFTAS